MHQNPELVVTSIKILTKITAEIFNSIFEPLSFKALGVLIFISIISLRYMFDRHT
jgi:hypothetical protein